MSGKLIIKTIQKQYLFKKMFTLEKSKSVEVEQKKRWETIKRNTYRSKKKYI